MSELEEDQPPKQAQEEEAERKRQEEEAERLRLEAEEAERKRQEDEADRLIIQKEIDDRASYQNEIQHLREREQKKEEERKKKREEMCIYAGCLNLPAFTCSCQDPPVLICQEHIAWHLISGVNAEHSPKPIINQLDPEDIKILRKSKSILLKMKSDLICQSTEEFKAKKLIIFEEYEDKMNKIKNKIEPILKGIENFLSTQHNKRSELDPLLKDLRNEIPLNHRNTKTLINQVLLRYIQSDWELDNSFIENLESKYNTKLIESEGFGVEYNSKTLIRANHFEEKGSTIQLENLEENLGSKSGLCELEDGKLFYCGGFNGNFMKSCYMFDPNTKQCDRLADLPSPNSCIIPLRIDNTIYILGGYYKQKLDSIWTYNLESNEWNELCKIPVSCDNVFSFFYSGNIYFSGRGTNGVLSFNLQDKTFDRVFDSEEVGGKDERSVLVKNQEGKVFYLTNNRLFQASVDSMKDWEEAEELKIEEEDSGEITESGIELEDVEGGVHSAGNCFFFKMKFYKKFNFKKSSFKNKVWLRLDSDY